MSGRTAHDFETIKATEDMSAKQFYIAKAVASSGVCGMAVATAATNNLLGVNLGKPTSGQYAEVAMRSKGGKCPVIYGGTVTAGDLLTTNSSGKAITATDGDAILGVATKSGVVNDIGEVHLGDGTAPRVVEKYLSVTAGAESGNAIDCVCAVLNPDGTALSAATQVMIRSLAVTADKGDLAAATSAVGTVKKAFTPATGENVLWMETSATGTFSFKCSNDQAEETVIQITAEGCRPYVAKLTFA